MLHIHAHLLTHATYIALILIALNFAPQREIRKNFVALNWLGYLMAIISYAAVLAIAIIIYHFKIWYAWTDINFTVQT